jgi:CMP-N-acetylneuraminic acid synthetase
LKDSKDTVLTTSENAKTEILGLIPARGGSKSIPHKNILDLAGHPLLAYVANAARHSRTITRLACSTDDTQIAACCRALRVEVLDRPDVLAQDDTPILAVLLDLLATLEQQDYRPEAIVLLQPTSPFVLPEHIDTAVNLLIGDPAAQSVQTISSLPHNHHAYNQRCLDGPYVSFRFPDERAACYNKQTKPAFYVFGNLVVTRTAGLRTQQNVFAVPSLAHLIPLAYALDLDGPQDIATATWYLSSGQVKLPPMAF